jgi:glycosidase
MVLQAQTLSQDEAPCNECWTMLEIHDWTRFLAAAPTRADLLLAGLAYLLLSPGTPIIYYGLEQGFNGNCPEPALIRKCGPATAGIEALCDGGSDDSLKRQDMFASGPWRLRSAVAAVDALRAVGPTASAVSGDWRTDPMLPRNHSVYEMARKLSALRRSCAALWGGGMVWHYASDAPGGWMAFARNAQAHGPSVGAAEAVALVNPGAGGWAKVETVGVSGGYNPSQAGLVFANVFDTAQVGTLTFPPTGGDPYLALPSGFAVAPGSTAVFIPRDRLQPWDNDLGIALCTE